MSPWRAMLVSPKVASYWQLPVQLIIYIGLFVLSERLVTGLHLPLPANIVGLIILLALLVLRILPVKMIRVGANWLLAEMLLFFVPAVVAVVNYGPLLRTEGWKILAVIMLSTVLVLAVTSFVVDKVYQFELKLERKRAGIKDE